MVGSPTFVHSYETEEFPFITHAAPLANKQAVEFWVATLKSGKANIQISFLAEFEHKVVGLTTVNVTESQPIKESLL
jgi:hypothetical protein